MTTKVPFATVALLSLVVALPTLLGLGQESPSTGPPPAPLDIPAAERDRANPVPPTEESLEYGRRIFESQCAMCHGKTGDGKGDLAPRLKVPVPDLSDPAEQKARTDGELFWVLSNGHGRMTGQGERLSDEVRWHLVNYMRTLAAPK
jgi:mono/diheme cytochrome c family protein